MPTKDPVKLERDEKILKICRILVYVFTIIGMLLAVVLIAMGAVILVNFSSYKDNLKEDYNITPVLCLVIGFVIIIADLVGFFAAQKEEKKIAIGFLCVNVLCIAGLIVIICYVKENLKKDRNYFKEKPKKPIAKPSSHMIQTQHKFQCCGRTGPQDYLMIPPSCCDSDDYCLNSSEELHRDGCDKIIHDKLKKDLDIVYPVSIVDLVIQIICLGLGIMLLIYLIKVIPTELSEVEAEPAPAPAPARGARRAGGRRR